MNIRNTFGFTIIELLTVVAVIGILSAVVLANLSGPKERARDSERVTEASEIAIALELYYNSCRQYPAALNTGANNGCPAGVNLGKFMSAIPTDPLGGSYTYGVSAGRDAFVIMAECEQSNKAHANDLDGTVLGVDCDDNNFCKGG